MVYNTRSEALPELAYTGGLVDPRADDQPCFGQRMACRDVTDFISNPAKISPLELKNKRESARPVNRSLQNHKPASVCPAMLDKLLARSREFMSPVATDNPVTGLIPGLIISGGLSRSPAFDTIPVVSHWADRTDESSATDPEATVHLSSAWSTVHVVGEGATMECPLGAPCWSLKTHGIGPVKPGSSKFSHQYHPETDTLVTEVNVARRPDTDRTGGVLSAVASISWMRNARVADAADCAAGLLSDAAALLAARNDAISTGEPKRLAFAEVRTIAMPTWCSARKPLPPKLSGVAFSPDRVAVDLLAAEECEGPLLNTSIFSMANGYNRGVYGGSISGLWSMMDAGFVMDYSVGVHSAALADKVSSSFADVAAIAEISASAGPHITDIRTVKGCNYACLRQKTIIEDTYYVLSEPCIAVWDDLARLARYKLADAVFCHVYYDSGGGEEMAAIAGLGCVAHDWIDLGADVACGEVSNIIPSLTRGSLEEETYG